MNIIKPIPDEIMLDENSIAHFVCHKGPVRQLEQDAGEMAKVIMHYLVKSEEEGYCELCENHEHSDDCEGKIAIEKYSGKTYEQLKAKEGK